MLGAVIGFSDKLAENPNFLGRPLYVGITIDTDGNPNTPDLELVPRQVFLPAVHALNATKLNGADWRTFFEGTDEKGTFTQGTTKARDALRADTLAEGAVGTAQLANGSVTAEKLNGATGVWLSSAAGIYNNSRVGIGTPGPQQGLSVAGSVNIDQNSLNDGTITSGANALTFGSGSGEGIASKRIAGNDRYGLDFYTSFANRMTIRNGGNVGIGTTEPETPLHVAGAGGITLGLNGNSGGYTALKIGLGYAQNSYAYLQAIKQSGLSYGDLNLNPIAGNVGIGTAAPTAKLHVQGDVRVSGRVTSDRDIVIKGGHKSPSDRTWDIQYADCSRFADQPQGFYIRLYAQHTSSPFEVWNYEGHVTLEQAGVVNNPDFPNKYRHGVIRWTVNGQAQFRFGHVTGFSAAEFHTLLGEGLINVYDFIPGALNPPGVNQGWFDPRPWIYFAFSPDWAGQVTISDN